MENIDKQIAIKVMGWTEGTDFTFEIYGPQGQFSGVWILDPDSPLGKIPFTPSTNIAQAFEVAEKMHQQNIWLRNLDFNPYTKKWTACFYHVDKVPHMAVEASNVPAAAICLAALKAIEPGREGG